MPDSSEIAGRIAASSKYRPVLAGTIARISGECLEKYGPKRAEKEARGLLHQVWGAYWPSRPDFGKLLEKCRRDLAGKSPREAVLPVLRLHASTRERVPIMEDFYRGIFAVTGIPETVADLGCGLNPLTLPWMDLRPKSRYAGYDIDEEQNAFLTGVLEAAGYRSSRARVEPGDVLLDEPPSADVIFAFKLMPLLERQRRGASLELVRRVKCRYLVASFPAAGLSGRKRGIGEFHAGNFERILSGLGLKSERLAFPNETALVVEFR